MRMYPLYRTLVLMFFLLVFSLLADAADTLKIHQTIKHMLTSSGQPYKQVTIKQKFFTMDDTLFREIDYSETTGQISSYMFYFYRDGRLFTQEYHNANDSLEYILKHQYDQAGNEILLTKLVPGLKKFVIAEKTVKRYNNDQKLLQQKIIYGKRVGSITRYVYNESGLPESEKDSYKPVANAQVKQETKECSYSPDNRIARVFITGKSLSDKPYEYAEEYGYNDKGLISSVKKVNSNNAKEGEKIYKYNSAGTISNYEEHNAEGILTLLLQYEYKKHYMNRGIQISHYEDF